MEPPDLEFNRVREAADFLRNKMPYLPQAGIILGTGMGKWMEGLTCDFTIAMSEIPNLLPVRVQSHQGLVYLLRISNIPVLIFSGRAHYYEGHEWQEIMRPVRILHELGGTHLILTNAAGGINPSYDAGDIVLIRDHINLPQISPLHGENEDRWGPRFPEMRHAYDPEWIEYVRIQIPQEDGRTMHEGVYVYCTGPALETTAEYEFLHRIGADVVGMSAVPEVIAARHVGLKVMGISVVSNECYPPERVGPVTVESMIRMVESRAMLVGRLIQRAIPYCAG